MSFYSDQAIMERLALSSLNHYRREGGPALLAETILLFQQISALRPPGHPYRSTSLNNLANAITERYEQEGDRSDLLEIIKLHGEALTLQPAGHPNRSGSLNNFASAIFARYQRDGERSDLLEVIELNNEALALHPPGHPDRSMSLNNLANAIEARYDQDGVQSDLLEVVKLRRDALTLRPPGHPNRSTCLNGLANAIFTRYLRDGGRSDLAEVIELHVEALTFYPPGHPYRSMPLNNLANAIIARYRQDGVRSDLSEAIKLHSEALTLQPSGHPERSVSLNNLAEAILTRYKQDGERSDLLEVIKLHSEALILFPPGHPYRSASLSGLANAIITLYRQDGEQSDLLVAIELQNEALTLVPPDHPHRSMSLVSLAVALRLKMKKDEAVPNISLVEEHQEKTSNNLSENHPQSSGISSRAGLDLLKISKCPSCPDDSGLSPEDEIVQLLRNAVAAKASPIPHRIKAALCWIEIATEIGSLSVLEAYQASFTHLGGALALGRTLQDRHSSLLFDGIGERLALDAALSALCSTSGSPKLAVELLDQGRNMLLASVGRFRADLFDIRRKDPALGEEFERASRVLESVILKGQEISERESSFEDPASRYQRVSVNWENVVDKIRLLPGCETFLLPVPYIKLQEAAMHGPVVVILVGEEDSSAIIVTNHGDPHLVQLPNASEQALEMLHEELEYALETLPDPTRAINKMRFILSDLWDIVVEPIIRELQEVLLIPTGSRIWWYPTSWASFLPLHAAGTYKPGGSNVPSLYISSYTPTLQALRQARSRPISPFDVSHGPLVVAQAETSGQLKIPCVNEEADVIRRLVPDTSVLSGDEGSKGSVLEELRHHSWVHLSCHGHMDPKDPFQSHFALHDGPLSLQDIITHDLPSAEFAYLSACHSAAPDRTLPDEGLTLAGGMQFVGFRGVVGTLWAMADDDAPTLARVFYNGVAKRSKDRDNLDCTKTAEALHEAVQKLREKGVPLYRWVNLVHYGI